MLSRPTNSVYFIGLPVKAVGERWFRQFLQRRNIVFPAIFGERKPWDFGMARLTPLLGFFDDPIRYPVLSIW